MAPTLCFCPSLSFASDKFPPSSPSTRSNGGGAAEAAAPATQGTKAQVVSAAVAAVLSPLESAGAHDDNEDDEGSVGPEISCRHSQAAVACEIRTQVDGIHHCFSWRHADRATSVLAELAKNGWVYLEDAQVHRLLTILNAAPV